MGVFYSSSIRFFGARAAPKEAGEIWQVRLKKHKMVVLTRCSTVLAILGKFQIQNDYWDTPCCSSYELLVNFLSKIVRNVAISI